MSLKLLIINPGSTSTKIAIYDEDNELFKETIMHSNEELNKYIDILGQYNFRKECILKVVRGKKFDMTLLSAVVGRGGLLKPIKSGTYKVNDRLLNDLKIGTYGRHASNLGGIIANEIAKELNIPAYIVDPVVVDELEEVAKITGIPELQRKSIFHALNQKAVARRYSKENGKAYINLNLVVAHLGGGVSVGAHHKGKIIDVNNSLDGDGPFSPERSGAVPVGDLIKLCFSGKYTEKQLYEKVLGKGGFVGYLNTNDAREVRKLVEDGDKKAILIYKAFIYQISKAIGEMATVLNGKVDGIIVTGGIAYWSSLIDELKKKVEWIAPITVYPGEDEMLALAQGTLRVLKGEEKEKEYV